MPVALQANALVSVEEVREFLGKAAATEDDVLRGQINRASDHCEWHCQRPLKEQAFTNLRLPGQYSFRLRPPATPIKTSATVTISVDGVSQTVWRTEADGDPTLKDVLVASDADPRFPNHFYRALGWLGCSAANPYPILLSYTGGLASIPGELKEACFLVIQNIRRAKDGLADVAAMGGGQVTGGVTFRQDLIPLKAKYILDSYRLVPV